MEIILGFEARSMLELFGSPDDLKLKSCATLFAIVSPSGSIFERLIERCYAGERDERTVEMLDQGTGDADRQTAIRLT